MSHYSDRPESCRVDFWRDTGKWYTTEAVVWIGNGFDPEAPDIHSQFHTSLAKHFGDEPRLVGMRATCLEPYHKYSHPISVIVKNYKEYFA
jgi:hypothetical protein